MLRIRNGHHLNPFRIERIEIKWNMPMAGLEQRNFHSCRPYSQFTTLNASAVRLAAKEKIGQQQYDRRNQHDDSKSHQLDAH